MATSNGQCASVCASVGAVEKTIICISLCTADDKAIRQSKISSVLAIWPQNFRFTEFPNIIKQTKWHYLNGIEVKIIRRVVSKALWHFASLFSKETAWNTIDSAHTHTHARKPYVCQNGNHKLPRILSSLSQSSSFSIAIWQRKFDFNVNLLTCNISKCECCNHRIEVNNIILCLCRCSISTLWALHYASPSSLPFILSPFGRTEQVYWIVATEIVAFSIWPNICLVGRWRYWVFISNKRIRIQMLCLASSLSI